MAKPIIKSIVIYFLLFTFGLGLYFIFYTKSRVRPYNQEEGFETGIGGDISGNSMTTTSLIQSSYPKDCPNVLVKSGKRMVMYNTQNTSQAPVVFESMDDYTDYLEKKKITDGGLKCPILFLQEESAANGDTVYRMSGDPIENRGLPVSTTVIPGSVISQEKQPLQYKNNFTVVPPLNAATTQNKKFNQNQHYSFDPYGQDVGRFTTVDQIHYSTQSQFKNQNGQYISANPMDFSWGGVEYTNQKINEGVYLDNTVMKPMQQHTVPPSSLI